MAFRDQKPLGKSAINQTDSLLPKYLDTITLLSTLNDITNTTDTHRFLFSIHHLGQWVFTADLERKAEALGYELPKPIGFNLSYMTMEQGINVDSIAIKAWVNCHCNYKRIR